MYRTNGKYKAEMTNSCKVGQFEKKEKPENPGRV
jgi:hypothetical protein